MDAITFKEYYDRLLPIVPLVLIIATIIIGFDCIWRVEKRLDTFLKLLTSGLIFIAVRKAIVVIGYVNIDPLLPYLQYIDIVANFLFLLAFFEMYRIIRSLNNEKKS